MMVPQKVKNRMVIGSSNFIPRYVLKRTQSRNLNIYTPVFIALFTKAKRWKQPKCPSVDEWIKKMWYIHTMKHYSTIKRNEFLICAITWMNLKTLC